MKISTDSSLVSLLRAIGRFWGLDILIISSALAAPATLFPWLIRNMQSYFEQDGELIYYIPYLVLCAFFVCTALLRNTYLNREGLASSSNFSPRMIAGNVLVIATVAAIVLKRHMAKIIDYVSLYERSTVALDILFVWVVANFLVQLTQRIFHVSFTTKER